MSEIIFVCPKCEGEKKDCRSCDGRGFVVHWDNHDGTFETDVGEDNREESPRILS